MKTAGVFDSKLMMIDEEISGAKTGDPIDVQGNDLYEMNVRVVAPETGTSLVVKYQGSDDKQNWTDIYTFPTITEAGEYNKKIRGMGRYRRAVLTASGDWGHVLVGISAGGVLY